MLRAPHKPVTVAENREVEMDGEGGFLHGLYVVSSFGREILCACQVHDFDSEA